MHVTKMHAAGNDFCLVAYSPYEDYTKLAVKICNRKLGIGADGLIVVKEEPLEMIFYNNDGSRAPMSGNGIRCFAKYAHSKGLSRRGKLSVITGSGLIDIEVTQDEPFMCKVSMGKPIFNNSMLAVNDELDCFGRVLRIKDHFITTYSVFLGSVHTIVFVKDFSDPVLELAKDISNYSLFTKQTNVNFVRVMDKETIRVKTYERGVNDFTDSCGSGACASVVVAQKLGYTKTNVKAELLLGRLKIEITKKGIVNLTGPAVKVFETEYEEE